MGSSESKGQHWSGELHSMLSRASLNNSMRVRIMQVVKEEIAGIYGSTTIRVNIDGYWLNDVGNGGNVLTVYASSDGSIEYFWTKRTFGSRAAGFAVSAVRTISSILGRVSSFLSPFGLLSGAAQGALTWY